jgi:hypothetical protein
MGLDVRIKFKLKNAHGDIASPDLDPDESVVRLQGGEVCSISTYARYYGFNYERGPWGRLCGILMYLLQHENVETVWYGNDCEDEIAVCTIDTVLEISKHYMTNGHRPYFRA